MFNIGDRVVVRIVDGCCATKFRSGIVIHSTGTWQNYSFLLKIDLNDGSSHYYAKWALSIDKQYYRELRLNKLLSDGI